MGNKVISINRLYIIEGLPCSGKSTVSAFVADELKKSCKVCYVDEGGGNHPADYEFHSFLGKSDLFSFSDEEQSEILAFSDKQNDGFIVPLKNFSGEIFEKLLQYKIYDFLPWKTEQRVMLGKWKSFVQSSDKETVYVFNCVLLQNPMCETMMRFGFDANESEIYIAQIAEIIKPMHPLVIYLKNNYIRTSVEFASKERDGWLENVIDYHVNGAYGKSINAQGFDGYIACLEERQKRELEILSRLDIESIVVDNPQADWNNAYEEIKKFMEVTL